MKQLTSGNFVAYLLLAIVLTAGFTYWVMPTKEKTVVTTEVKEVTVPLPVYVDSGNYTYLEGKVDQIANEVLEDQNFEDLVIELATDEWSERDYRDIYEAIDKLYGDIVEKEDISSVEVREEDVTNADSDDGDAIVVQEVKVRYEDKNGESRKVYLLIKTEVEDSEVDSQKITKA